MNYYFITGTSRGIGEAIANELLSPENKLFCISRSENKELMMAARERNCELIYHQVDLSRPFELLELVPLWLNQIDREEAQSICMIHNAGVLTPVGRVGGEDRVEDIVESHHVNFMSPVLMTERFVEWTQDWEIDKKVLMISSGAARKARTAWSTYCSTKAALEMFAACMAEEQKDQDNPIQVVSLAPGVVDTAMQDFIRTHDEEEMPGVSRFIQFKAENILSSPKYVAERITKLLQKPTFGDEVIMDLRG
jgi:benzil reductase ((S)-benzoin forming)